MLTEAHPHSTSCPMHLDERMGNEGGPLPKSDRPLHFIDVRPSYRHECAERLDPSASSRTYSRERPRNLEPTCTSTWSLP